MNAIVFLLQEHAKVRAMFSEIANEPLVENQKRMFETLSAELIRHETMEQLIWYPNFRDKVSSTVSHLVKEEKAEKAIEKLQTTSTEEDWQENFMKLRDDVEHHAQEEEQSLFPEVQKLLNDEELEDIGQELEEFKLNYEQSVESESLSMMSI